MAEAPEDAYVAVSLAINATPEKLYEFWRKLDNLPRFMEHLESVQVSDELTSHWVAKAAGGVRLQWDAEIVEDQPGRFISWQTLDGSEINHCGSVRFERPASGDGTIVRVEIYYGLPGGQLASRAASLISVAPETMVREDLWRLKQLIETGEIATTRGQPSGVRSLIGRTFSRDSSRSGSGSKGNGSQLDSSRDQFQGSP